MHRTTGLAAGWGGVERRRVRAVVETLATSRGNGESLEEMAHDARNMVTALGLYCDLLEEPGVLAPPFAHYGNELRLVAAASRRLVEKLVALDSDGAHRTPGNLSSQGLSPQPISSQIAGLEAETLPAAAVEKPARNRRWDLMPAAPIDNLAAELLASRNLLAALAGPAVALTVVTEGGRKPVRLTGEDLTRVLVNLVKNAAEAMPRGGRIQLSLCERPTRPKHDAGSAATESADRLVLTIEDDGPGIPVRALEEVFESGFTTRANDGSEQEVWPATHRGMGLSIARAIVEAAGGRIRVAGAGCAEASPGENAGENPGPGFGAAPGHGPGASLVIELPVRTR